MKNQTRINQLLTVLLLLCVSFVCMAGTAFAAENVGIAIDLSTLTETYLISDSGEYIFTGSGSYGIKVESGNPTIVLNNASITVGEGSAIDIASGSTTAIQVLGDNTISTSKTEYSYVPCGGIFVAEGGTVNITSNGTDNILRAHGTLAAAIGGKYDYDNNVSYNAGNINISNVTVYAYTNNFYAAAIGAAGEGTCGTINITNAVVYAYGAGDRWTSAPGIGNAWSLLDLSDTIPIVIISDSEVHTFRYNPYSDYIGYLGDESGDTYATGSINCGDGGSVKNSTIYCYTGLTATTTDKVVKYGALGGLLKEDGTCEGEHSGGTATCTTLAVCENCGASYGEVGGHTPDENGYTVSDGTHSLTCTVCGSITEPHTYDDENGTCVCGAVKTYTITLSAGGAKIMEINGEAKEISDGGTFTVPHGQDLTVKFENTLSTQEKGVSVDVWTADYPIFNFAYDEATNIMTIPASVVNHDLYVYASAYVRVQFNLHGGTLTEDGEAEFNYFGHTWNAETATLKAENGFIFFEPEYFQLDGHTCIGAKVEGSDVVETVVLSVTGDVTVDILWNCTDTTTTLTPVEANAATCIAEGNIAHYICTCGKLYADENGTTVLTAEQVKTDVDPDNHVGMDSTTGKCACGEDMAVAKVEFEGNTTYHATLEDLESGCYGTLTLLADCSYDGLAIQFRAEENVIDLNGHTLESERSLTGAQGTLTIIGSGTVKGAGITGAVDFEKLIIGENVNLEGTNGYVLLFQCGTFDLTQATIPENGWGIRARNSGDGYGEYSTTFGFDDDCNVKLRDGFAAFNTEGNVVAEAAYNTIVTIKAHTEHDYVDGVCGCGVICDHDDMDPDTGKCPVCGLQHVATVTTGGETTYYKTLQDALAAANEKTATVKLLAEVTNAYSFTFLFPSNVTLDMNGQTLTMRAQLTIASGASLTITGNGTYNRNGNNLAAFYVYSGGTLTIVNGTFEAIPNGSYVFNSSGTLNIQGGTFIANANYNSIPLYLRANSVVTVSGTPVFVGPDDYTNEQGATFYGTDFSMYGAAPKLDLSKVTGSMDGWRVQNRNVQDGVTVGQNLILPSSGYALKVGDEFVTTLATGEIGTIVAHTHDYTTEDYDATHHWTACACGATTEKVKHTITYTPVTGKEVHIVGCSGCTYTAPEEIPHEFTNGECVCTAKAVAKVEGTCYSDFAKALEAWTDGTTLTLLADVSYDSDINLGAGTRTFAGGEHTLTLASEANWIDNDGTLTIASGTIISEGSYAIQNSGTLNIEGGMVSATAVGGVAVDNMDGTLNITGGTVSAPGLGGYAIVNHSSMTLDGGTIEGYSCIENSGTAELKRGKVTASDGYALNNFGTATLSGADLATEGNNPAVFCSSGKTTISGGTLAGNGAVVIWRVDGTLTITTTGCNGWKVISSAKTATIGEDITLPEGYYMFVETDDGDKIVTELAASMIGTIGTHTADDHNPAYKDNEDGVSHDESCTICGAGETNVPHACDAATGKCVCGAKIVAMVDDTCYSDINVAINDWENNAGTLTLLDNVSYAYPIHLMSGSYIFEGGNFELDMDGYELNVNGGATLDYKSGGLNSMLSVYGTLNATGGTIKMFIFNFGVVNLSGARVVTTAIAGSYAVENYGDLTISSGSLECVDDADAAEIFNAGGTVTIENTAVPEGWRIKHTTEDTLVLDDYITLPDGFYVFMDKKIVTELAAGEIGTITCHPDHTYICTADDDTDTITYACSCGVGTRTAKLAVPASPLVYDGEAHPATVEASDSTNVPVVTYTLNGQAVDEPINAGSYTATMTWGEASVSADITITPASLTAVAPEGSRAYDATAEWVAPLEMTGVMNDDDVRGVVKFTLPGADAGEYTEATVKAVPELTGKDAGNYTLAPEAVSFSRATITRAAADKWNVSMASPQNVLVGSGLNAVAPPAAGTGIDGETVQITNVTFYTDAAMQTPAEDADISSLAVGESMTLYYVADAKNYESATGSLMLKAVDHLHEWHYAADAESSTIVATCGGTIGTCPTGTVTFKLVPPAEAVYGSAVSERRATCDVVPAAGTGTEPTFTYEALPGNAMLDSNGNPENAGEYKVTMALGGVSVSGTMAVAPAQIGRPAGYDASGVYNGQAHKPQVNYPLMTAGKDYTLTCPEDMVNAGRKTITVTGIGNYTGTVSLDYEITKAILTAVTEPVDQTLTVYCADADAAISRLPAQVSYTAEDGSTVLVDVVWNCPDYDATPKATNTFTWTAVPAQLASCELAEGVPAAGTITVTGADAGRPDGKPPVIDAPDVDQEVTVYEGERGTMTVTATDAAGYQWYINRYDGRGYVPISGATSSTYITSAVTCDNNGFTYYCVVSNENGDSQSPFFTLKVPEKMDIPQTGDNSNITLWFALMLLSIAGLAIIMKANRRDSITR